MSEPKFENRPFERLNHFPTLRGTFSLKMSLNSKILSELDDFVPLRETQFLFGENCTPLRDFRVVKKVPFLLAHTCDPFLPKYPRGIKSYMMFVTLLCVVRCPFVVLSCL